MRRWDSRLSGWTPEVRRRLAERGIAGEPLGPEELTRLVKEQVRGIGGLVAGLGMQLD